MMDELLLINSIILTVLFAGENIDEMPMQVMLSSVPCDGVCKCH